MDILNIIILFIFGLAIGSFLNVVASRYDGEHFLFDYGMIGGRSHCTHCGKTLRWFELFPLVSFLIQGGRCRRCKAKLSIQYPLVELISGLIFAFVPIFMTAMVGSIASGMTALAGVSPVVIILSAIWIVVFEALLVMSIIDIRLGIIPDEIVAFLFIIGLLLAIASGNYFGDANHSFLGFYSMIFGWQGGLIVNRIIAALFGGIFFGLLIVMTRGKGMGMGDLKLAIPLGLLFGWPDIIFVLMFAFVFGAIAGLAAIARRKNTMKGTLPFGPFLAIGAATVFFFGFPLINWYFTAIGIR